MGVLSRRNPAMSDLVIQADAFAAAAHAAIDHRRKYADSILHDQAVQRHDLAD